MNHLRLPSFFLLSGLLQWALDTTVMIALSQTGYSVALATIAGRIAGAACGYLFNARITFASPDAPAMRRSLPRFVGFWLLATAFSAVLLTVIDKSFGLHLTWLSKPGVDALMAVAGYLASRYWIYRSDRP